MIHLIGDTHGVWKDIKAHINACNENDFLLQLGDFGFIFDTRRNQVMNELKVLRKMNKLLKEKNITLCFIDGNHENFNRLKQYETVNKFDGKAREIDTNIFHLKRGEIFTIEEKKFFVFGGANSIDRAYRIENVDWWKDEEPTTEEFDNGLVSLDRHKWKVDYILTHTIFDDLMEHLDVDKWNFKNDLNKYFLMLNEEVEFDGWIFGHFHKDKHTENFTCLYKSMVTL